MRSLEDFVPSDHTPRATRKMASAALSKMNGLFAGMYEADAEGGRPSVTPEKLLRGLFLQVFYSVRSERQLMEQVQYNRLFRWLIRLSIDGSVWVSTVFAKNRERLIKHDAVNRHGLVANAAVAIADGYAERQATKDMINYASRCLMARLVRSRSELTGL